MGDAQQDHFFFFFFGPLHRFTWLVPTIYLIVISMMLCPPWALDGANCRFQLFGSQVSKTG